MQGWRHFGNWLTAKAVEAAAPIKHDSDNKAHLKRFHPQRNGSEQQRRVGEGLPNFDGQVSNPALTWSQVPAESQQFAVHMSTPTGDGSVR